MAKRISSFTKEYDGLENSKVIEILEQNGIAGKKAQSGLSEDEEKIVVKALASMGFKKIDATKENEPSVETEKKTEEAKPKAETVKMEETKPEGKEEAKPEAKTEAKPETPKKPGLKKKNIIIVGNEQNRNQQNRNYNGDRRNGGGQYRPQGGNNYSDNRGNNNNNFARPNGPIRPRANMIDRAAEVTNRRLQAEKEEQMKEQALLAAQEQARRESAAREQERQQPSGNENRPQGREDYRNNHGENRYDNRNNQGGYRGGQNRDGQRDGQRPYRGGEGGAPRRDGNGDNRFRKPGQDAQRGFQRPGSKPAGKGFGGDVPMPEEKHRDDEKRRNNIQDKDKKSKKDHLYEEDGEMTLGRGRNSKAGRFIKPVKAKEEKVEDDIKVIVLPDEITIKDLADKMKIQPSAIVKKLFMQGEMVTVNQEISFEKAEEIALEYEIMCEREEKVDVIAELLKEEEEAPENLVERPPVICVMGHVDHGKTSLLDAIRKTHVTDREAGGITQHIGAYTVNVNGKQLTFLDTPGHEAFTSMRMRGANSTDIAILVVAADDGVMPQTVEAINHAKAAGIEIVVAVNKIDKPGANVDRVKQELTEYELISEDWGGTTIFANVSAKTGEGIEELLEMVLLSADVLELKSNPNRQARGLVIEAELDKGRGPVATVLVQKGTLHVGDFISAGASHGKVRAMVDDKGRRVKEAGPSTPVEILGLNDVPNAGEIFICHDNDKLAKNYAETFIAQNKAKLLEDTKAKMSLDDLFSKIQEGNLKELNLIIKADVQGSVEAVKQSLLKLSNEEVVVKVIHGGVGAINESDVILASASEAIIIGFNVRPDAMAKQTAEREGVDVRLYKVIYQAIEDIEAAMKGMLDPVFEEKVIGHAEVRQIFKASAIGNIAGAFVLDGMFQRGCKIRISREGEQIYEGNLASLKRFKDDVKEVKAGFECGLVFEGFEQMQELDIVEAYIMVEVPR